jgi:GNAT superfamily N-acetyltransferase
MNISWCRFLPVYKCPKCGRQVELPEGTYYCKFCGPTAILTLVPSGLPEFEFKFEIPSERSERVKKQLLDYIRLGLNVRRNVLYDPKRASVRVVEWSRAPTIAELAPEFKEIPIGRLIVTDCTIEDIELAEPVRGIGLGRAIVERLKEELKRRECKAVWLWAARVAPERIEFWRKMGVRVVGQE